MLPKRWTVVPTCPSCAYRVDLLGWHFTVPLLQHDTTGFHPPKSDSLTQIAEQIGWVKTFNFEGQVELDTLRVRGAASLIMVTKPAHSGFREQEKAEMLQVYRKETQLTTSSPRTQFQAQIVVSPCGYRSGPCPRYNNAVKWESF